MDWEKEKKKMEQTAELIAKALVGKTIASVTMPVNYPGNYSTVEIRTTAGDRLTIAECGSGCPECDPEGIGYGVNVDFGGGK